MIHVGTRAETAAAHYLSPKDINQQLENFWMIASTMREEACMHLLMRLVYCLSWMQVSFCE